MAKLDSKLPQMDTERDDRLAQLFGDMPLEAEVTVNLPSKGKFYVGAVPTLTIQPIKFEDEKQLAVSIKNKLNPINILLSRCIKNFDINSLLILDKMVALLKLREISYGEDYPVIVTCEHCSAKEEINIKLNELLINYIPDDIEDPREITLPKLKKKVKVRFPRVSDEQYLINQDLIYANLWRFIVSIDGVVDPVFISKAIPKMAIMDIKFILKNILREDLGLDPKFIYSCESCGAESTLSVPVNENFFSVT